MVFSGGNHIIRELKLSIPPPLALRERRGGRVQSPVASDFINHTYVMEFPLKPQRRGFGVFPYGVDMKICGESREGIEVSYPFPITLALPIFIQIFLTYIL